MESTRAVGFSPRSSSCPPYRYDGRHNRPARGLLRGGHRRLILGTGVSAEDLAPAFGDLMVLLMGEDFLKFLMAIACVFACSCEYRCGIACGDASEVFFSGSKILSCRTCGVDLVESAAIAFDSDWCFRWSPRARSAWQKSLWLTWWCWCWRHAAYTPRVKDSACSHHSLRESFDSAAGTRIVRIWVASNRTENRLKDYVFYGGNEYFCGFTFSLLSLVSGLHSSAASSLFAP